jgi:peptide/nickel transport system substrate-binding protein
VFVTTLSILPLAPGCSSKSEPAPRPSAAAEGGDEFAPLEPYDAPPLAEIDAKAKWVDQPVRDAREVLRQRLAEEKPPASPAEALALRNDSDEANDKIYSVVRQLPQSDDEVDWDATFVRCWAGDAKSLNPLMINLSPEMELLTLTGLQLIGFDHNFTPFAVGWAVKSWQSSEDHMMDKFVLRDDLTWSDGKPLTAHDVVFSFKTIMDPNVPVPAVRSGVQHVRWIEAYDDHTLVIFHKEPMASWTENIQFPIVPKHIYEKSLADDPTMMNSDYHLKYERQPVTCGPYEYVKRVQGQETVMRRRESYYMHNGKQVRDKPFLKEIRTRVVTDPNTALLALKSGDVDDLTLSAEQWVTQTDDDDFYRANTKVSGSEWTEAQITWNL